MTATKILNTVNLLPNDSTAEKNLIGLSLTKEQIPVMAKILSTTDFYDPFWREIWSAFLELEENAQPIEAITAWSVYKRNHPNSSWSIANLLDSTFGMVNTHEKVFVDAIKSASVRRFLIRKLSDGIRALETDEKGVITSLRRELNDLEFAEEVTGNFQPLSKIIDQDVIPALHNLHAGITHKISTGFPAIDKLIGGGLSLTDVLLIAAAPGVGKSAFVLQLAANIAQQKIPVAFLSCEMSNKENGFRLISQQAGFTNLNSLTHIDSTEHDFLVSWAESIKQYPMFFDTRTYDLRSLSISLRAMVEQSGVKVLVIDYIQLLKLNRVDKHTRTERITETSQEVKRIAMEYGIAVIEVAQFNREGAKSGIPTMHDLEGSSQLEKDTSLIFIIDRPERSDTHVTLRIEKGRNSGEAALTGRFEGWRLTFDFEN